MDLGLGLGADLKAYKTPGGGGGGTMTRWRISIFS